MTPNTPQLSMRPGGHGVDRASLEQAAAAAHQRFVRLVAGLTQADADRPTAGCPGWTAADVAAHVITLFRRALGDQRRSESPEATADLNALCLTEVTDRNPRTIAATIDTEGGTALANLKLVPADLTFPFHAGATTNVVASTAVILGELVIHGQDIARATGRDWAVGNADAEFILDGGRPLIEHWLDNDGRQMLPGILDSHPAVEVLQSIYRRNPPSSPALAALIGHLAPF